MLFQYTHHLVKGEMEYNLILKKKKKKNLKSYPTIVTEHKTQFFTHFSKKKQNWLFQRVTYDTSFGYFHVWEKIVIKRVKNSHVVVLRASKFVIYLSEYKS